MELNYPPQYLGSEPGMRVAPVLTVMMLSVSMVLSFSMMVKADMPKMRNGSRVARIHFVCVHGTVDGDRVDDSGLAADQGFR